ncbi:unnamed protein product [Protopolystoma xenopodis]|uniref:Uncharacterized protein n=1 Tax=Protopolystoma xenopodis TaxID=117903 RepID=A0A3S5BKF1_9PLAT|nr:unnamed protein product [Protopolystoma xenopodis]
MHMADKAPNACLVFLVKTDSIQTRPVRDTVDFDVEEVGFKGRTRLLPIRNGSDLLLPYARTLTRHFSSVLLRPQLLRPRTPPCYPKPITSNDTCVANVNNAALQAGLLYNRLLLSQTKRFVRACCLLWRRMHLVMPRR